jgi:hypothetical protein
MTNTGGSEPEPLRNQCRGYVCFWASWIRIQIFLSPSENVPSKSKKQKNCHKKFSFLLASKRTMTKLAGSGSGSISHRHGSADTDPDPDPHQNVIDPQGTWCRATCPERRRVGPRTLWRRRAWAPSCWGGWRSGGTGLAHAPTPRQGTASRPTHNN